MAGETQPLCICSLPAVWLRDVLRRLAMFLLPLTAAAAVDVRFLSLLVLFVSFFARFDDVIYAQESDKKQLLL